MKTKNITSLLATIFFYVCLASCTKDVENHTTTTTTPLPPPPTQVTWSNWFGANWTIVPEGMQFIRDAYGVNVNFLSSGGKVLVFGKGGSEHPDATVMPSSFDGNYIALTYGSNQLRFFLQGKHPIQSLQFRYILIPSGQQPLPKDVDYNNYESIRSYYHIPE
jgi:hypothetical protein